MGFDAELAQIVGDSLKRRRGITTKRMFGGLCFLHNGNMLCGVDNRSRLMVRVGPDQYERALKMKHARRMDFTGKPLRGMIYVAPEGVKTKQGITKWVEMGLSFTKTLPRK